MKKMLTNVLSMLAPIWAVKMVLSVLINLVRTVAFVSPVTLAYTVHNVKVTACYPPPGNYVAMVRVSVVMTHLATNAFVIKAGKQMV